MRRPVKTGSDLRPHAAALLFNRAAVFYDDGSLTDPGYDLGPTYDEEFDLGALARKPRRYLLGMARAIERRGLDPSGWERSALHLLAGDHVEVVEGWSAWPRDYMRAAGFSNPYEKFRLQPDGSLTKEPQPRRDAAARRRRELRGGMSHG
jgi:hypothetical protein